MTTTADLIGKTTTTTATARQDTRQDTRLDARHDVGCWFPEVLYLAVSDYADAEGLAVSAAIRKLTAQALAKRTGRNDLHRMPRRKHPTRSKS